jgi:small subunit ribosomal protein S16
MLAIKFKRIGKKRQASFRIVIGEKRSKLQGRFVEDIGWFNPRDEKFKINKERAIYWIGVGAQPTASIHNLFVKAGVVTGKKIAVHGKSKKKAEPATEAPPAAPAVKAK